MRRKARPVPQGLVVKIVKGAVTSPVWLNLGIGARVTRAPAGDLGQKACGVITALDGMIGVDDR